MNLNELPMTESKIRKRIQELYDTFFRHHLPRKWCVYDTIPARDARLFDTTDYIPDYKPGIKQAIIENIEIGDDVCLVGGGRGISSVWLANQGATVTAYEVSREMISIASQTVDLQSASHRINFVHAGVGNVQESFGETATPKPIDPAQLQTRDVLILDCEGSETDILSKLTNWPTKLIVETHPDLDVSNEDIRVTLTAAGYSITKHKYSRKNEYKKVIVGSQ